MTATHVTDETGDRRRVYRHAELAGLIDPQSVAIIGASPRPNSFGDRVRGNLAGFRGRVHLVNGKYAEIGGSPCHPSLAALPEVPDCAVIVANRETVEGIIADCAGAGVRHAIVFASGYAETGKPERAAQQARLATLARRHAIRLIGPNCIGIANYRTGAAITFSGTPHPAAVGSRAVGVVSQSGALGFALAQGIERGVAISHVLTSGNGSDVDTADFVAYLAEEPSCRAIACLFEGIATPRRLIEAAEIAWDADKPLVICKIATGEAGARAAMSHTGSLAGTEEAWQAAFARAGVVSVTDFDALLETASFLAKAPPPAARGVVVVATSGGAGIMAADKAERHRIALPQPAPETTAILESRIPEFGSPRNPCDVTAQVITDPESFRACCQAVLADPAYGALVTPLVYSYAPTVKRLPVMSELAEQSGKIVCNVWLTEWPGGPGARETQADPHLALFRSMEGCFATLAAWHVRADRRAAPAIRERAAPEGASEAAAKAVRAAPGRVLTEREAKEVLALYGIPVIAERLATETEDAVGAAASLGYPVAMKIESPDIPHKTEAGVIRLGIDSADAARRAFAELVARAGALEPPPRVNGVLVQQMARPGIELMLGARVDPLFGPTILVGLGGLLVELLKDVAVALAPVSAAEALAMLRRLKGFGALRGFRGSRPVDLDGLAAIIGRFSELAADQAALVSDIDVNPVICDGDGIVAVDALMIRHFSAEDPMARTPELPGGSLG